MSKELEKEKTEYWIKNLKQNDIPAMKVNFPEDIFDDKHLKETNFFKKSKHPTEGDLLYPSFPVEFDEERNVNTLHAPTLGENTKEILIDLGFSIENIAVLCSMYIVVSLVIILIFWKLYNPILEKKT